MTIRRGPVPIDMGPCRWVPVQGASHRPHAIADAVPEWRREQMRRASAAYRARRAAA